MQLLWTVWAASALAVFTDQAYKVDWQYYGLGVPKAAIKTEHGHVVLTEKSQLAYIGLAGDVVWRKEVDASRIALGDGLVYTQSDVEVAAWHSNNGTLVGSVRGGSALCATPDQVAIARGSDILLYSPDFTEVMPVSFPGQVSAVDCETDVVGWVGNSAYKVIGSEIESLGKKSLPVEPTLKDAGISVDAYDVVSTDFWSRPEGLTDVLSVCFLEIESQANKPELPTLSDSIMENWTARVKRHVRQLTRFRFSTKVVAKDVLFGYHKALVLATAKGSVYAFDTLGRSIIWEKHIGAQSVETIDNLAVVTLGDGSKVAFTNTGEQTQLPEIPVPSFDFAVHPTEVVGLFDGAETWRFSGEILTTARRDPREVTSNVGSVVGDAKVRYKYLNPNLVAIATLENEHVSIAIIDGITGRTIYTNRIEDPVLVDEEHKFSMVLGEHWVVFTYTSLDDLASAKLTVLDLYESPILNERVSPAEVNPFTDSAVPWVAQRTVILPKPIKALGISATQFGVTQREILAATDLQVFSIPKNVLSALRTSDEAPKKGKPAEEPDTLLSVPAQFILSHERIVKHVRAFSTATTLLESTYVLCAYGGLDIFYTRVSPSGEFDRLPESFETTKLVVIIVSLVGLVAFLRPLAKNKALSIEWA